ncbi:MAG: amidase [Myxococcota bacterium]
MFNDYTDYDGIGLAALIAKKEVTAAEVLEAAIARAEAVNPQVNAIVTPLYEWARSASFNPTGVLAGVPFLLKDVHHALAGTPMSNGSLLHQGERSRTNATIVQRWLDAGLVVMGKTNTPEYKLSPTTDPRAWGATRNPWNLERTPGGSSGGSAAAVAARIVPLASATDEAGSIRMPAANCGLFGLKPSRGRNPIGPDFRWELAGLSTSGVISRTVRDTAAALDASAGSEPGSPYYCPPSNGFLAAIQRPPRPLRVALATGDRVFDRPMDQDCVQAIQHAGKLLADLGHEVDVVKVPFDEAEVMGCALLLIASSFGAFGDELVEAYGAKPVKRGLEPLNRFIWKAGRALPGPLVERTRFRSREIARAMAEFHEQYDVLVTSTFCQTPRTIEETNPTAADTRLATALANGLITPLSVIPGSMNKLIDAQIAAVVERVPFRTSLANVTGQPAMSAPLCWTGTGLPVGVQFLAPFGGEEMLLQLATQLESATSWDDRRPPNME